MRADSASSAAALATEAREEVVEFLLEEEGGRQENWLASRSITVGGSKLDRIRKLGIFRHGGANDPEL
jgi:hypothetical protein